MINSLVTYAAFRRKDIFVGIRIGKIHDPDDLIQLPAEALECFADGIRRNNLVFFQSNNLQVVRQLVKAFEPVILQTQGINHRTEIDAGVQLFKDLPKR